MISEKIERANDYGDKDEGNYDQDAMINELVNVEQQEYDDEDLDNGSSDEMQYNEMEFEVVFLLI